MDELEQLKTILSYDPETGDFSWLVNRLSFTGKAKQGTVAGTLLPGECGGYIVIVAFQKRYRAHRLAHLFMTGRPVPKGFEIDHINGNRADNRWSNLRVVTRRQNCMNHAVPKHNVSGVRGVSWHKYRKGGGCWMARIEVNGKVIHLGVFSEKDDAIAARRKAEELYCGQFRRVCKS